MSVIGRKITMAIRENIWVDFMPAVALFDGYLKNYRLRRKSCSIRELIRLENHVFLKHHFNT